MSNTGQTATEPLRGRDLETSERVVHVTRIDARIGGCDGVCLAPQGLAVKNPRTLRLREVLELRHTAAKHIGVLRDSIEGIRHNHPLSPFYLGMPRPLRPRCVEESGLERIIPSR